MYILDMYLDSGVFVCSLFLFLVSNMYTHFFYLVTLFKCRTLSSSDDVQDRETEKGRLEEAFETCDRGLDQLIVQHYAELTTAIRTYQSITERITSSRNKIKQVERPSFKNISFLCL